MYKIYLLSGLSGTGKTTLGLEFIKYNKNFIFIDQDSFYKKEKPKVKLSNGEIVSNWDCVEAIDFDLLNEKVNNLVENSNVLLVGFALLKKYLNFSVEKHIHLQYNQKIDNNTLQLCIKARINSKKYIDPKKQENDIMMVEEFTIPFYIDNYLTENIDYFITVYRDNKRRSIEDLLIEFSAIQSSIKFQLFSPQ